MHHQYDGFFLSIFSFPFEYVLAVARGGAASASAVLEPFYR
jgi:hypothetical protein